MNTLYYGDNLEILRSEIVRISDMPEGAEVYILRNKKDPDEIIAFGLVEGNLEEIMASMDPAKEEARQASMAPFIESVGADGIYDVIERIGAKTGAQV